MTEPNYQRPPLREEIETFFKQVKGVIITIISLTTLVAIAFGLWEFSKTNTAHQIGIYFNKHFPTFIFTAIVAFPSYNVLYMALYRKHLIYKRYRIGYFSQMMWCFIGFFTLQLGNIPIALYMNGLIPIFIIELVALGITTLALSDYKKEHPPLARPLTKEENELRNNIIKSLLQSYRTCSEPIESDANAFARACYLMDFHPEFLDTLNANNSGYTIPSMFYSNIFDNSNNKLSVNTEDSRYKTYRERAHYQMKRDQKAESPFNLYNESFFD